MNKISIIIFFFLYFFSSCKGYKTIYENELDKKISYEEMRDTTDCRISLCVVFEKPLDKEKIDIESWSIQEIIFSNNHKNTLNDKIAFICSLGNNPTNYYIYVNKNKFYIDPFIYEKYRYLVVSKEKSKLIFRYTNEYYDYKFKWLCDNAVFHY